MDKHIHNSQPHTIAKKHTRQSRMSRNMLGSKYGRQRKQCWACWMWCKQTLSVCGADILNGLKSLLLNGQFHSSIQLATSESCKRYLHYFDHKRYQDKNGSKTTPLHLTVGPIAPSSLAHQNHLNDKETPRVATSGIWRAAHHYLREVKRPNGWGSTAQKTYNITACRWESTCVPKRSWQHQEHIKRTEAFATQMQEILSWLRMSNIVRARTTHLVR